MDSVADDLRIESARTVASLPTSERVALALRLGDRDVALYRAAHRTGDADARRALTLTRSVGRQPSRSNAVDIL